ncbi:MAG: sulfatase family protein [Limisphaerales bacterium]
MRFGLLLATILCPLGLTANPLNILLITADDLGIQLSCYGDKIARTPNIDRFAAGSVRFKTAYVSQASCSPSRSTMFTGLYPHANGQYGLANANVGFRVHEELIDQLLPNVLKNAGYRTGIIGKLHVNPEKAFKFDQRWNEGFGSREIRKQVGFAREFLNAKEKQPWFLMFNLFDPHVARKRLPNRKRGPSYFPDQVQGLPKNVLDADDVPPWPWQQIDTLEQRTKIAGYYNCVHRIDAAIGMLMKELQNAGHADDTLIIFLGDHGPPFFRGKTSCYEAGLRVPFIVNWPGVSQAHVSDRLSGSIDIYPTILDAANVSRPAGLHGRSLRPVLRSDTKATWRKTLVAEFHYHGHTPFFPRRAITDGHYKLIHNLRAGKLQALSGVDGDTALTVARKLSATDPVRRAMERTYDPPELELYDLDKDPIEFHNLAEHQSVRDVRSRLRNDLRRWQELTKDPFVDPTFRDRVEKKYRPGNK